MTTENEATVVPLAKSADSIIQKLIDDTAEKVRAGGTPDALNRWLGMTPEQYRANEKARETVNKQQKKIGPKEGKLAAQRAAAARTPGSIGGLTEADKKAAAELKKETAKAAQEKMKAKLAALKERKAGEKRVKAAAKAAKPIDPKTVKVDVKASNVTITLPKPPKETLGESTDKLATALITGSKESSMVDGEAAIPAAKKGKSKSAGNASMKTVRVGGSPSTSPKAPPSTAKAAPKVPKMQMVEDMLFSKNGASAEEMSKASGWPHVNLKMQVDRAKKRFPNVKLVETDGRFRLVA